jgi:hypothetical protein
MSGSSNTAGQVLGASTAIGGIAMLPYTGNSVLVNILAISSIALGLIVLSSFFITRILKKIN